MTYPPLPSLREVPLHSEWLNGREEWACIALADGRMQTVRYDWRCNACIAACEQRIAEVGDRTVWFRLTGPADDVANVVQATTLSWLVARARTIQAQVEEDVAHMVEALQ